HDAAPISGRGPAVHAAGVRYFRLPATTSATPATSAMPPITGESGIVFRSSLLASIGPSLKTFSRVVYVMPWYTSARTPRTISTIPASVPPFISHGRLRRCDDADNPPRRRGDHHGVPR